MPHIHVKIVGKSEAEKTELAAKITKAVKNAVGAQEANISVSIEGVAKEDWVEKHIC
jgi:4-oxalocrotonate tautomerase